MAEEDAVMAVAEADDQQSEHIEGKDSGEQQDGEDEWHTTGSKYLDKRVARGVFDNDDWLLHMEFGTVVGWLPVEVADFISEHTNKPAALWRIKFDNNETMGEEDLEEFEVKQAMKDYKETLQEQREGKKVPKRRPKNWSKPDENYEDEDEDEDHDEQQTGQRCSENQTSRTSEQGAAPAASRASTSRSSRSLGKDSSQTDAADDRDHPSPRSSAPPLLAPDSATSDGLAAADLALQLRGMEAELARSKQKEEDAERRREEAEGRCAAMAEALAAESAKVRALRAELQPSSSAQGGEAEAADGGAKQAEEYQLRAQREREERVRGAQQEAAEARRQAREQIQREVAQVRRQAAEEVARVRRDAEEQVRRVRRQGEVEVGRTKRRAEAEAEALWRAKMQRTGDEVLEGLCDLRGLARACHEAGRKTPRVLEEVAARGQPLLALAPSHRGAVGSLLRFLGRYALLLGRPPLSALATITQLASQEPPGTPLARSAKRVLAALAVESGGSGAEKRGWAELREGWVMRRVGGGAEADACALVLGAHAGGVRAVAVSADGSTIASGGSDKAVRVWDAATGQTRGAPKRGHSAEVTCVAVSADGAVVASGGRDKMVRLWAGGGAGGGVEERELRGHMGEVTALAMVFSKSGGLKLVSGGLDETLRVWGLESGTEQRGGATRRHPEGVTCLAVAQQDGVFVSGGRDGMVRVWATWGALSKWKQPQVEHSKPVAAVACCGAGGEQIASIDEDGRVLVWSLPSEQLLIDSPPSRHHPTVAAALTSSPSVVATGGLDTALRLWDVDGWQERCVAAWGHTEEVSAIACGPGGMVVTGSADSCVRVWFVDDLRRTQRRPLPQAAIPSGDVVVAPRSETPPQAGGQQAQSELSAPESEETRPSHPSPPPTSSFPSAQVVSVHRDRQSGVLTATGWRVALPGEVHVQGRPVPELAVVTATARREEKSQGDGWEGHDDAVTCVAVSGSGLVAASGSRDATVRLWDTASGRCVGKLEGHKKRVTALALSWDGKRVVSGGADKTVRVWSWVGEECCFSGHKLVVLCVALSPCGGKVASGSKESKESVRIWDVASKQRVQGPVDGNTGGVGAVWFSSDGQAVGCRSLAGRVAHWDCATGAPAPERDPPHQQLQAPGAAEKQGEAQAKEQLQSARGRHRVVAEDDLVLVFAAPAGVQPASSKTASSSPTAASAGGAGGSKGTGMPAALKDGAGGNGGGHGKEDKDKDKEGSKERCCGMYRARGLLKAVRVGPSGVVCAGCESGEVLILKADALAAADSELPPRSS